MSPSAPKGRRLVQLRDLGAGVWFVAALLGLVLGALIVLGLGVYGLSKLVGSPLAMVRDDPKRVEWDGLALDLLYGLIGAAALFACHRVGRRLLPTRARHHVGRALSMLALLALAVGAGIVAVLNLDLKVGFLALVAGAGAVRMARGLSLVDEQESPLPASFDTPIRIVNEQPTARVEAFTPPPPRPFTLPGPGSLSRPKPVDPDDNPLTQGRPLAR